MHQVAVSATGRSGTGFLELWREGGQLYWRYLGIFIVLLAPIHALILYATTQLALKVVLNGGELWGTNLSDDLYLFWGMLMVLVLSIFFVQLPSFGMALGVGYGRFGHPVNLVELFLQLLRRSKDILLTMGALLIIAVGLVFVMAMIPVIGTLIGQIFLMALFLVLCPLMAPVVMLERRRGFLAFVRTWELIRQDAVKVLLVVFFLNLGLLVVVSLPWLIERLGNAAGIWGVINGALFGFSRIEASAIVSHAYISLGLRLLYLPWMTAMYLALYFDLHRQEEQSDAVRVEPVPAPVAVTPPTTKRDEIGTLAAGSRPLGFRQQLRESLRVYRHYSGGFTGLVALFHIPAVILTTALFFMLLPRSEGSIGTGIAAWLAFVPATTWQLLILLVSLFWGQLAAMGVALWMMEIYLRRRATLGQILRQLMSLWRPILTILGFEIGVGILLALVSVPLMMLGTIIQAVGLLLASCIYPLVAPIVVLEQQSGMAAVRRAWNLLGRHIWKSVGLVLLLFLALQTLITLPVGLVTQILNDVLLQPEGIYGMNQLLLVMYGLTTLILGLLYLPWMYTAFTVLYFNLRVWFERQDLPVHEPRLGRELIDPTLDGAQPGMAEGLDTGN